MKSRTASPATEFPVRPFCLVWNHSGPTPHMNSTFLESVHGFLNRRSASHSVECRAKSEVMPASSSSHLSIGVTSTATVGPKLEAALPVLQPAAPPSSTIAAAAGSLSTACATAPTEYRNSAPLSAASLLALI